jgi:hypothetical protein
VTERSLTRLARTSFDAPENITVGEIYQTLEELRAPRLPLKRSEPGLDGQGARLVEDGLRPIGAAIDPRLSPDQAKAWRKAVLLKLSNLPADVLVSAVRRALHTSFKFLGDVEPEVRAQAGIIEQERKVAIQRLERWKRDLERATAPALPAPEEKPLNEADIEAMNATMRSAGLATRWRLEGGEAVMVTGPSDERRMEQ